MPSQLLQRAAQSSPDRVALVCGGSRLTYRSLQARARHVANLLLTQCPGGGRVAAVMPNSIGFVELLFGCAEAGVALLPLDPIMHSDTLAQLIAQTRPDLIITDSEGCAAMQQLAARGSGHPPRFVDFEQWSAAACPAVSDEGAGWPPPQADTPAIYLSTSGSTGLPKLVCRTHEQLHAEATNFVTSAGLGSADNFLCVLPLHHSYGLEICLLGAVAAGSTLVMLDSYDARKRRLGVPFVARCREVLSLIDSESISVLPAVPQQFLELSQLPDDTPGNLSGLKLILSSACPLPPSTFERFRKRFGRSIRQSYGSSEAGTVTLNMGPEQTLSPQSVGTTVRNVSLEIAGDGGRALPPGQVGNIRIRSAVVTPQTAGRSTDVADDYFDSGDIGYVDPDGQLYITQRATAVIDVGGYKVDPRRVERILLRHSAVIDAVVYAAPAHDGGDAIAAAVQLEPDCTLADIQSFCRDSLAPFECPTQLDALDPIPRSPLGKVQIAELCRAVEHHHANQALNAGKRPDSADRGAHLLDAGRHGRHVLLSQVRAKVAQLLNIPLEELSSDSRLQDVGFDSVRAAEFRAWLESGLGFKVPITVVWNSPTLSACTDALLEMNAAPRRDEGARIDLAAPASVLKSMEQRIHELNGLGDAELYDRLSARGRRRNTR